MEDCRVLLPLKTLRLLRHLLLQVRDPRLSGLNCGAQPYSLVLLLAQGGLQSVLMSICGSVDCKAETCVMAEGAREQEGAIFEMIKQCTGRASTRSCV